VISLTRKKLPTSVQELIRHHLDTAADVETLLLLRRDGQEWTAATVARELRMDVDQAGNILSRLQRTGLLQARGGAYRFDPRDPALAGATATLAQLYPAYRLAVVSMIYGESTGAINDFR
jgi:hypothetical protein